MEAERDCFGGDGAVCRDGRYSLKWNHYETCMTSGLAELLEDNCMTDVCLACEGNFIQAHKIALAVSSPFFKQFFKLNRVDKAGTTLIALANVKFNDLKNIIQFIYHGEVHVSNNSDLNSFLATANMLQIKGLGDTSDIHTDESQPMSQFCSSNPVAPPSSSASTVRLRTAKTRSSMITNESSPPPFKQTFVSTSSVPHVESEIPNPTSVVMPPSSLDDLSLMHDENEEEEDMISLDDVKSESISVYSMTIGDADEVGRVTDASQHSLNTESSIMEENYEATGCDDLKIYQVQQFNAGEPGPSFLHGPHTNANVRKSVGSAPVRKKISARENTPTSTYGTSVGRCKFCPKTKTVSRTRCFNCKNFLCAKQTCRVYVKLNDGHNNIANMCRVCAHLMNPVVHDYKLERKHCQESSEMDIRLA